jgi:hypothetical protein
MDVTTLQQQQPPVVVTDPSEWEEAYRPLPYLFCSLFIVWALLVFAWMLNTWTKRRWQVHRGAASSSSSHPPILAKKGELNFFPPKLSLSLSLSLSTLDLQRSPMAHEETDSFQIAPEKILSGSGGFFLQIILLSCFGFFFSLVQTSTLQWVLAAVPTLKTLVHVLSFVFWYSCLNSRTCSFWVAFGVFLTRIFFETAYFVAFLLIAHGYCIMHEQLAIQERRTIAGLASLLYLILTGYKAAVPQFAVSFIMPCMLFCCPLL